MSINLDANIAQIRTVDSKRNYWFLRTYGGATYNDFVEHSYIGIGFNAIPNEYLIESKDGNKHSFNKLREFISTNTNLQGGEITKWTNQLINFQHFISIGDVVIIPSKNSDTISIGEIESEVFIVDDKRTFVHDDKYEAYPEKRRKVKWFDNVDKSNIKFDLAEIFYSRTALTSINKFAYVIEGRISSLFIKENKAYLTLSIGHNSDINAFEFHRFLDGMIYFYNEFCLATGQENNEELYIKIKMQSNGKAQLIGAGKAALAGIFTLLLLSRNNELHTSYKDAKLDFKQGDGVVNNIFSNISNFLNENEERREKAISFDKSIKYMEALQQNQLIKDSLQIELLKKQISDEKESSGKENNTKD